jgi:hypothetical protein
MNINFYDKNGFYHRENGPAFIRGDSIQAWVINGKLHRLDGPAYIDGEFKKWYINDKKYNETEYHEKIKEMGLG